MFAFYRKMRRKLLEEGHLKKYLSYALGEVLLVTVGILLALQVNNWNQNLLDSREESRLLSALSEEMQLNRFRYERGMQLQDGILVAAERLLVATHNPVERPSEKQIDQDIPKLMGRFFLTTSSSTYDVLVGSGQLGLLSSAELRTQLAGLKLQMELLGTYEVIQANYVDEQLSPFLNRSMDRLSGVSEELELSDQVYASRFSSSYDDLLASRTFANLLVDLIRHTRAVRGRYSEIESIMSRIDSLAVGM